MFKKYTQEEIKSLQSGQEYENCIFDGLEIKSSALQDCVFTNCSFSTTDLTNTKFNGTTFKNCNFSNANIAGCNFFSAIFIECKLLGLIFSRASSIIGIQFAKCNFDFADMRGLDLSGLDLSRSSFSETDLSLANLEKTSFINSYIANVKLDGATCNMTDFRGAELQGFNLKTQNLKGIILTPQQVMLLASDIGIQVLEATT